MADGQEVEQWVDVVSTDGGFSTDGETETIYDGSGNVLMVNAVSAYRSWPAMDDVEKGAEIPVVPLILDIDPDLDGRVAVDMAVAELMYNHFIDEMVVPWDEMRPRLIRRFNYKYGIKTP